VSALTPDRLIDLRLDQPSGNTAARSPIAGVDLAQRDGAAVTSLRPTVATTVNASRFVVRDMVFPNFVDGTGHRSIVHGVTEVTQKVCDGYRNVAKQVPHQ
jgi:hypothetical protein